MELTRQYKIKKDSITYRIIDGEAVILNLGNGYYYSLNEVGTKIWESMNRQETLGDILGALKKEYEASEEQLKMDLARLIKDLESQDLISHKAR